MKTKFTLLLSTILTLTLLAGCNGSKNVIETSDAQEAVEVSEESLVYEIDTQASTLGWSASKIVGGGHTGTMEIFSGEIFFDADGNLKGGKFEVDMNSITEDKDNEKVIAHLKNEDFFDVVNHPTSTFEITDVNSVDSDEYTHEIEGNLTIKDITKNIAFSINLSEEGENYRANSTFEIDRTEWDIRYNSAKFFSDLGDKAIKDSVEYTLDIVAVLTQ